MSENIPTGEIDQRTHLCWCYTKMTEYQRGYTDNYAGVPRHPNKSQEWLAGWDSAQTERLKDEREIRKATTELQSQSGSVPPLHFS